MNFYKEISMAMGRIVFHGTKPVRTVDPTRVAVRSATDPPSKYSQIALLASI